MLKTNGSIRIVGLMSGTSADGIDAAVVEFQDSKPKLVSHSFSPYSTEVRNLVLSLCRPGEATVQDVSNANFLLGELFAESALHAVSDAELSTTDIDAIASHGQTIWHQPEAVTLAARSVRSTLQIGEAAVIAEKTGIVTVSDFRTADVAAGGQGAPLVPFADFVLFRDEKLSRAVQNIGGIANLTYLPANCTAEQVLAFDTGPGNMLIDAAVQRATNGAENFDRDGKMAASGRVCNPLLHKLMQHPFLSLAPPKTTGRETFGEQYFDEISRLPEAQNLSTADLIATLTAFTSESIADAYEHLLPVMPDEIILGGGGTYNPVLRRMLKDSLPNCKFLTHEDFGIPSTAKEAMAFAILAFETLNSRPSNIPSATGATHPAILGKISLPFRGVASSGL